MQIWVIKNDGTAEPYLHTKVLATFNYALALVGNDCLYVAEQLAEAVTFYVYGVNGKGSLTTDEIHLMILSVLSGTGYEHAAQALGQQRLWRRLQRRRIEVVWEDPSEGPHDEPWDKSRIVRDLTEQRCIEPLLARTIAGAVEEKVLGMKVTKIRKTLIHELVMADMDAMLEAHCRLSVVST